MGFPWASLIETLVKDTILYPFRGHSRVRNLVIDKQTPAQVDRRPVATSMPVADLEGACYCMNRIAIFADVQNIYYTTRDAYGKQFNYRKLWGRVSAKGEIVAATAYATDRGDEGQQKFQDALRDIGFTVKLKPYVVRGDGSAKADWDVGITIDVLETAPNVDTVVLLSGDGDFAILLDKIRKAYGVNAEVWGVQPLTANSLIESASTWHAIDKTLLQ